MAHHSRCLLELALVFVLRGCGTVLNLSGNAGDGSCFGGTKLDVAARSLNRASS